jgi:hypothetical protein
MTPPQVRTWFVECDSASYGPFKTREKAEKAMSDIVGFARCPLTHVIIETMTMAPVGRPILTGKENHQGDPA